MIRTPSCLAALAAPLLALLAGPAWANADGPDVYRVTAGERVALRAGPGAEHPALIEIAPGTEGLANFGCRGGLSYAEWEQASEAERAEAAGNRWCRVGFDRQVGWVRGTALGEGAGPDAFDAGARLSSLEGTEWRLVSFGAERPVAESAPGDADAEAGAAGWIRFEDGSAGGVAFCNNFRGSYEFDRGRLSFGPVATTFKMCIPWLSTLENRFQEVLTGAAEAVAAEEIMAVFGEDGRLLATFARRDG